MEDVRKVALHRFSWRQSHAYGMAKEKRWWLLKCPGTVLDRERGSKRVRAEAGLGLGVCSASRETKTKGNTDPIWHSIYG